MSSSGTFEDVAAALPDHEVGRELGRGQFGIVYAARHRQLHREVAVKQLVGEPDEATLTRFRREARILAQLDHPHVVRVYDYREEGSVRLLVMEQLTGGSFADRMGDDPSLEDAVAATLAAATGLHRAHDHGVLHRDVKPENLMIARSGELKVTDFGIARGDVADLTAADLTQAGSFFGTPAYAAPEQVAEAMAAGWPPVGAAADQWALAAILYRCLAGRPTHESGGGLVGLFTRRLRDDPASLVDIAPGVPAPVADVVMRALSRHPDARYPTTEAFAVALAQAMRAHAGAGWLARSSIVLSAVGPVLDAAAGDASAAPASPIVRTAPADADPAGHPESPPAPSAPEPAAYELPTSTPRRRRAARSAAVAAGAVAVLVVGLIVLEPRTGSNEEASAGDVAIEAEPPTTVPADEADLAWRFPTGDSIRANPLVAEGVIVVGSFDHNIYGIDASTGVERWRVATDGAVRSSAVSTDGTAFVGSDDGYLRALALADGVERWRAQVGFTLAAAPAVVDGHVIVGADQLYAYDRADGTLRWTFSTGGGEDDTVASSPTTDGSTVFVGSDNGNVYGIDAATGAERWRVDAGAPVQSSPAVDAGLLVVGTNGGELLGIDVADGTVRWRHDAGAPVRSSPALAGTRAFVGTGAGRLIAVDRDDGTLLWSHPLADKVDGSPLVIDDVVAIGANDGTLVVVGADDGSPRAWYPTGGPILARPAVAGATLIVPSYDGVVSALHGVIPPAGAPED